VVILHGERNQNLTHAHTGSNDALIRKKSAVIKSLAFSQDTHTVIEPR
jgi:hypothetical protein